MTHSLRIGAEAIRDSVERILASDTFARSEKLRGFLSYVVEKEQSGAAHALKGYSIGVDVFGRPEAFDPGSDPLVRVQAGKLRKLLDRYYETEGLNDAVRIAIPTGGYVPRYQINHSECPPPFPIPAMPAAASSPVKRAAAGSRKKRSIFIAGFTAFNIALTCLNVGSLAMRPFPPPPPPPPPPAQALPMSSLALPRVVIDAGDGAQTATKAIGEAIRAAGKREPAVDVVTAEDARKAAGPGDERLEFRLSVKPGPVEERLDISLVHMASGNVIYRAAYDVEASAAPARLEAITHDLITSTMPVSGEIYRFAARSGFASDLMQCMSLTELYNTTNTRLAFISASACQKKLVPENRPGSIYSNLRMLREACRDAPRRSDA